MDISRVLLLNALALFIYMSIWFCVAYTRKRVDAVDTAWGGGFIVLAISTFIQAQTLYSGVIGLIVTIWGLRLAVYISLRNRKKANDVRYDTMTAGWSRRRYWLRAYVAIFLLQGALVYAVGLPISMSASILLQHFHPVATAGLVLWLIGFIVEAMADAQLRRFLLTRTKPHTIMQSGLWRYSRHPNYFGEIVQWWGIGLIASASTPWYPVWVGPLVITYLIIFVSGLPPLEARYKDDDAYQAYAAKTSPLVPLPPKR